MLLFFFFLLLFKNMQMNCHSKTVSLLTLQKLPRGQLCKCLRAGKKACVNGERVVSRPIYKWRRSNILSVMVDNF